MSPSRKFAWSVRREIWENRSIWLVPLVIALLVLVAFVTKGLEHVLHHWRDIASMPAAKQRILVMTPFGLGASATLAIGWVVGAFYTLDCLSGERRDRSILFWKSMPVSDLTTVLAKAFIPLAVLPAFTVAVAISTTIVMLALSAAALAATGRDVTILWAYVPWLQTWVMMGYGMAAHALWFAPIFGWLLLVSAWARRSPFLWAFVPFFAVFVVEKVGFGTSHVQAFITARITGAMPRAFDADALREPITLLAQAAPAKFFATPELWVGLAFAAACVVGAVQLRRNREPN